MENEDIEGLKKKLELDLVFTTKRCQWCDPKEEAKEDYKSAKRKRRVILLQQENKKMSEEFKKTSVTDLVKMWIDMMRANTQHMIDENCTQWRTSVGYNKAIENLETAIANKLEITVLEVNVMLNYK